jgi:signal transduction histidine kinase
VEGWAAAGLVGAGLLAAVWLWRREGQGRRQAERRLQRRAAESEAAEARHTAERARWDALGKAASDLILTIDPALRVVYANGAAEAAFGPLAPGASLMTYTHSVELERLVSDAGEATDAEGLERMLTLRDRPHRAKGVAGGGYVVVALQDVSEVQRLSRARQDMIANLSHELRTPLASLRLLAETLAGRMGEDPKVARPLAEKITAEVETLHQMTQEMLDLAAIESGRQVVRLVSTPLREILAVPLERVSQQARRRGIHVEVDRADETRVLADREQAQRAVVNVLHNAVKFSPDGGEVKVTCRTEADQGRAILSVQDDGPGLAPEDLERIFERFYRADEARGTPGTGLGLAIARHILRAHGGQIWAENRPPPRGGAVFHLAFQLA